MRSLMAAAVAASLVGAGANAGPDELWDVLRMDELVDVMAEEGRAYGTDLAQQLFERGGGPTWDARVAGLYDAGHMAAEVRPLFAASFAGVDTAPLEQFFSSELGARIVGYELEARRALLDPEVEAAAAEGYAALRENDPQRDALIGDFIQVNDLLETNVASSLTFTYAFNLGLVHGGMEDMTDAEALEDAWDQEATVRDDTLHWLEAQLSVAFAPLSEDEVRRYVELSGTESGETLNAALFQAFEPTFTRIARGLGAAVARAIEGHDI